MRPQTIARTHPSLDINPYALLGTFVLIPYLLFYMLLCVVTGAHDPWLLLHALRDLGETIYFRAWFTGSILFGLLAAWWFGAERLRRLVLHTHQTSGETLPKQQSELFLIQIAADPTPGQSERYGRLALALDAHDA